MSPLLAMVKASNQPPLSSAPFALVKSIDTPLFTRSTLKFLFSCISKTELEWWRQWGDAWNIPVLVEKYYEGIDKIFIVDLFVGKIGEVKLDHSDQNFDKQIRALIFRFLTRHCLPRRRIWLSKFHLHNRKQTDSLFFTEMQFIAQFNVAQRSQPANRAEE